MHWIESQSLDPADTLNIICGEFRCSRYNAVKPWNVLHANSSFTLMAKTECWTDVIRKEIWAARELRVDNRNLEDNKSQSFH